MVAYIMLPQRAEAKAKPVLSMLYHVVYLMRLDQKFIIVKLMPLIKGQIGYPLKFTIAVDMTAIINCAITRSSYYFKLGIYYRQITVL